MPRMQAAGKANGGDDILCQYLQTSRALACVSKETWRTACYEMLMEKGKFPVKEIQDEEGSKQRQLEDEYSVQMMLFQCEDCWTI